MAYIPNSKPLPHWANAADLHGRVELALHADEPEKALICLVRELYTEGLDEAEVLGLIVAAQARRRAMEEAGQPTDEHIEDAIVSVGDFVSGFCSPHALLQRGTHAAG
jgi:hypothetical protein